MKRLIFLIAIIIIPLIFIHKHTSSKDDSAYNRLALQQRIGERFKQESQFTRDPKTGKVPSERLLKAKAYTQNRLKEKAAIAGVNWQERGPNNVSGRTRSILIDANDPTGKTLFCGGVSGGLWKSTDEGLNWTPINEFFNNMAVTTIAQDPLNSNIIYFGTGEGWGNLDAGRGMGIWKSTDGGQTFSNIPFTANQRSFDFINKLVVQNYFGNSILYAGTASTDSSRGGLLYSKDGGNSWFIFTGNNTGPNNFCTDVEITASGRVLAGFGGGGGDPANSSTQESDGVYFSDDGGDNWTIARQSVAGEGRLEIAVSPSDPNKYYLLCENFNQGLQPTFYRTAFLGNQLVWVPMLAPFWLDQDCNNPSADFTRNQDWYDLTLAVYPGFPNSVLVGGVDLFLYHFDGINDNWAQLSNWAGNCNFQYVHADQHVIVFKNDNEVFVGNDGGVFKSNNATTGLNFSFLGNGLNITQLYSADADPTAGSNRYLSGAQDNGSPQFSAPGLGDTEMVTGGDGSFSHIDQLNPNVQITAFTNQNISVSLDNWQTDVFVSGGKGRFINPTDYDDINKKLYASEGPNTGTYFRWDDVSTAGQNTSVVTVSGFPSTLQDNGIWAIRVSTNVSGRAYFGFDGGTIVRVDNAHIGTNKTGAQVMNLGLGSGHIVSCIDIEDGNENHILVTLSNYGITSVYESTNANSANPTWTAVEGNLPDMPVRWAMINPTNPDQAFLATELGIWSTDNLNGASTNWGPTNTGLANTRIDMIKYRKSDLQMVVATHGRGMYTSDDLGATCHGTLQLNNQVITGTHKASSAISISNSSVATSATLSSPDISFTAFTVNDNAQLTVDNSGCQ